MKIAITGRNIVINNDYTPVNLLRSAGFDVQDCTGAEFGFGADQDAVIRAAHDADAVIAGLEPYTEYVLKNCPRLKLISRRGIGYDSVDLQACRQYGIALVRTAGAVEAAVAEHVLAYILYFARELHLQNTSMHSGIWQRHLTSGAKSRTLGLVGFGGIGKEIAVRAAACGMKTLYFCRHPQKEWEETFGVRYCTLEQLLQQSDYVSVNVPLTEATRGMFDRSTLLQLKPGSVFINIARGPVADENALADLLLSGHLRGAGIDVFNHEPCTDSPLHRCPTAILTPHTATFTEENFAAMNYLAAKNVIDFFNGTISPKMIVQS